MTALKNQVGKILVIKDRTQSGLFSVLDVREGVDLELDGEGFEAWTTALVKKEQDKWVVSKILSKNKTTSGSPILMTSKTEPSKFLESLEIENTVDFDGTGLCCDYAWRTSKNKLVVVERKDVDDLVASFIDGRLRREVSEMCSTADIGILLIEGSLKILYEKGTRRLKGYVPPYKYSMVTEGLATLQAAYPKLLLWDSPSISWTTKILKDVYKWSNKDEHVTLEGGLETVSYHPGLPKDVAALCILPGVGPKTAKKLYEHCNGIPMKVFSMTEKEFIQVDGVGKIMARNIRSWLDGKMQLESASWRIDVESILVSMNDDNGRPSKDSSVRADK